MTNEEALKVCAVLAATFPARIPLETVRAWARALAPYERVDAEAGVDRLGRTAEHPSLKAFVECIEAERAARLSRTSSAGQRPELVANATPDPEQALRSRIARSIAFDIVAKRIPKDIDFTEEVARRLAAERAKGAAE